MPVKKAVLLQILPAIASQMVALLYSLADTFFVGQLNDPDQTAAVTVAGAVFLLLTALSNLFGIGGASLVSRKLGLKQQDEAKEVSAFCFYGGLVSALLFGILVGVLSGPILRLCGAKEASFDYAKGYLFYSVVLGAVPTVLTTLMANLVRAEGSSVGASIGVTIGCVVNIILDPIFVLPFGLFISLPVDTLLTGAHDPWLLSLAIIGAAAVFFALALWIWTRCERRYESTGS
jgi:Na+-driven multidrug efflux pump